MPTTGSAFILELKMIEPDRDVYEQCADRIMEELVDLTEENQHVLDPRVSLELDKNVMTVEFTIRHDSADEVTDLGIATCRSIIHGVGGCTPQKEWDQMQQLFRTHRRIEEPLYA